MGRKLITAPVARPVTLQEAKDHLRVDDTADDALIDALIDAALDRVEGITGRRLITQTWDYSWEAFPAVIEIPGAPLQAVTSITYADTAGATQTLGAATYEIDDGGGAANPTAQRARARPVDGASWPSTKSRYDAVTVRVDLGYGAGPAAVPRPLQQATLMMLSDLYDHRGEIVAGITVGRIPDWIMSLLKPYRLPVF